MTRRIVGIDLGTTHSVMALGSGQEASPPQVLEVPQLVAPQAAEARPQLPSFLYAAGADEEVADPWSPAPWTVGHFAQRRGAERPARLISSAKSWLGHAAVDRTAAILPWGAAAEGLPCLSPVAASRLILQQLSRGFESAQPGSALSDHAVVLTVPASFDQGARRLTVQAAGEAGLHVRLLEEPQAAFYDWLAQNGESGLSELLGDAEQRQVLVCDVGGGTTDLTLLRVARSASSASSVERTAVGRHLLLGGDNMDLALAHGCEARLVAPGEHLAPRAFAQLVQQCRQAKQRLLGPDAPEVVSLALAGSGSALVGSTHSTELTREEVERVVLDGFFPLVGSDARPRAGRAGFRSFGLPYEADPAITKHIAAFLQRQGGGQRPSALLLNGGVFKSPLIVARICEAFAAWHGEPVRLLAGHDPDLAVARGAVVYGRALAGLGIRIGGGSAHGYYVAVDGGSGKPRGLCLVPRGARESERYRATGHSLGLRLGQTVRFELYASDGPQVHAPGQVLDLDPEWELLPPLASQFESAELGEELEVALEGELSPVGTLDVTCVEAQPQGSEPRRFELAFELRGQEQEVGQGRRERAATGTGRRPLGSRFDEAVELVQRIFGKGRKDVSTRETKDLWRNLERILGERKSWDGELTRALFDVVAPKAKARKRSVDHERLYWMLVGFCLRPGFGDHLDSRRIDLVAPLASESLSFHQDNRSWQQFWIAWRRLAGGLSEGRQQALRDWIDPWLAPDEAKLRKPRGPKPGAHSEMLELASHLERVPPQRRAALGQWLLERTWTSRDPGLWRALGKLGARCPSYASAHFVVSPRTIERWLDHLLRERWNELPTAARAAFELSRLTGDRARDLPLSLRRRVARRLEELGVPELWPRAVLEAVEVGVDERAEMFGEELPVGLRLIGAIDEEPS